MPPIAVWSGVTAKVHLVACSQASLRMTQCARVTEPRQGHSRCKWPRACCGSGLSQALMHGSNRPYKTPPSSRRPLTPPGQALMRKPRGALSNTVHLLRAYVCCTPTEMLAIVPGSFCHPNQLQVVRPFTCAAGQVFDSFGLPSFLPGSNLSHQYFGTCTVVASA